MGDLGDDSGTTLARWLAGPDGATAIGAAGQALHDAGGDSLAGTTHLRRARPELSAARASAALEQAELRELAASRYGVDARSLLLTRDGLEQSTRPQVAEHRARLLWAAGARRVVDLTGGLGFDASAFASAGLQVTAVESDPTTAILLAHNCPGIRVITGDSTQPEVLRELLGELSPADVVFADPARRDASGPRSVTLRANPERDPARWSPPWPAIEALPHPRVAAKVAPAFRVPQGWHAEWISVARTVVECGVYSWPAFAASRRATVWTHAGPITIEADDESESPVLSGTARWLHEVDPAVLRAGAVHSVVRAHPYLWQVDVESSWLASVEGLNLAYLRSFAVIEELQGSATSQRRQLDRAGVATLTIKSRDAGVAPHSVLRELDRREGGGHVLVVTRRRGRTIRVLCEPARQQPA